MFSVSSGGGNDGGAERRAPPLGTISQITEKDL